jgi:hypothetical protein
MPHRLGASERWVSRASGGSRYPEVGLHCSNKLPTSGLGDFIGAARAPGRPNVEEVHKRRVTSTIRLSHTRFPVTGLKGGVWHFGGSALRVSCLRAVIQVQSKFRSCWLAIRAKAQEFGKCCAARRTVDTHMPMGLDR